MLAQRRIDPVLTGRFRLEDAAEALNVLAGRQAVGKCVLTTARGRHFSNQGTSR
jgi:NADPH:quinone reductase-like Zn-dependent oxidoreductase